MPVLWTLQYILNQMRCKVDLIDFVWANSSSKVLRDRLSYILKVAEIMVIGSFLDQGSIYPQLRTTQAVASQACFHGSMLEPIAHSM